MVLRKTTNQYVLNKYVSLIYELQHFAFRLACFYGRSVYDWIIHHLCM